MFDKDKSYSIGVWDMVFYVVDDEGNPVMNDEGNVRIFRPKYYDYSHCSDGVEVEDLEEVGEYD